MLPPIPIDQILDAIPTFQKLRVLVVGDFFLDEYVEGEMFEISKEGPIPVIRFESRVGAAGAAGNLAASIRNLGAHVKVVGLVGDDENGRTLTAELEEKRIDTTGLLVDRSQRTHTYGKYRARVENAPSREILRIDILPGGPIPGDVEARVLEATQKAASDVDGIIVLDQVNHLITPRLLKVLPALAKSRGALLHGSSRDRIGEFHDFDLIIPNDLEASAALVGNSAQLPVEELGEGLKKASGHIQVLVTLGPDGMAVFPRQGPMVKVPTFADEVVDVTGAGDAVASTAMLANLLGWDLTTVAWTASQSAAIALAHVGTHHVTREELVERITRQR